MAHVELSLPALPAHVRTARLVVVAAARRAGLDDSLVDEVRLAVGEACARAVGLHAKHAPAAPVRLTVADDPTGLTITVVDQGPAAGPPSGDLAGVILEGGAADDLIDPDVALAVLSGLVDDCTIEVTPTGTTVTMRWPLPVRPVGVVGPGATVISRA
ncbi:MAG: anti-sigma regulatory factor [Frankiales bacterium]|nr:anti-sigma regulatory factor [Frankiales bacterium]